MEIRVNRKPDLSNDKPKSTILTKLKMIFDQSNFANHQSKSRIFTKLKRVLSSEEVGILV